MIYWCVHKLLHFCCFYDFSLPTTFGFDVVITILRITLQLRVDLIADQTQKVFDRILTKLGCTVPPVPRFCMQKGGKKLHFLYHALSYSLCITPISLSMLGVVPSRSTKSLATPIYD